MSFLVIIYNNYYFTYCLLCMSQISTSDGPINCIAWFPGGGRLISGGNSITMWKNESNFLERDKSFKGSFVSFHSIDCSFNPVHLISFPNDVRMFATCGQYDRIVRVWHRSPGIYGEYSCVLLPHKRGVIGMNWRDEPPRSRSNNSSTDFIVSNILLTVTRDHSLQLWQESGASERFCFTLVATLNGLEMGSVNSLQFANAGWVQYGTAEKGLYWLYSQVPSVNGKDGVSKTSIEVAQVNDNPTTRFVFDDTGLSQLEGGCCHNVKDGDMAIRLGNIPNRTDSRDWIVSITLEGDAIIWLVEGLVDTPRRSPRATIYATVKIGASLGALWAGARTHDVLPEYEDIGCLKSGYASHILGIIFR